MSKNDAKNDEAEPVEVEKQPAAPRKGRAAWLVPNGIAWTDPKDATVTIRAEAGAELEDGVIPAALVDEYAGRGDIIKLDTTEEN